MHTIGRRGGTKAIGAMAATAMVIGAMASGCGPREGGAAGTERAPAALASGTAATPADAVSAAAAASIAPGTKGYAAIGALRMYYERRGSGRPLVLLHGGGSTVDTTFGRVLPAFAKTHDVIAPEQQGHGHTADIDRPFAFEQMADDTAALLTSLGIAQADIFGFSNGGNVAMQLAIRHPALVRKLIVGSSFFQNAGIYAPIRESFKRPVTPKDMPPVLRDAYQHASPHPDRLQTQVDKLMAMMSGFKDWKAADLQAIRAPMLIMLGDADAVRPEHAVEMFRLVPHAQLAIFPGTGHGAYIGEATNPAPCRGCPDAAIAMIEAFLDAPMPAADASR